MIPKEMTLLMADDDEDDREMARDALAETELRSVLRFVENGEQLLDYLNQRGAYAGTSSAPRPGLILLDLNMPRVNGREALNAIKADPVLRGIPVVVFTTSQSADDVQSSYALGANSYVSKPVKFAQFVETVKALEKYWFEIVELPSDEQPRGAR